MKGILIAIYVFCSSFLGNTFHYQKTYVKPMAFVSARPTHTPKPTKHPKPTITPTPTATPLKVEINSVVVHSCSPGSSCYSHITGVEAFGKNFASDSQVKLVNGSTDYMGTKMGATGSTSIITDFMYLPHCTTFDTVVFGSTGTATLPSSVTSICP